MEIVAENIKFSGYLEKKKKFGITGRWRKTWCVLKGTNLHYYKTQNHQEKLSSYLGFTNIASVKTVQPKLGYEIHMMMNEQTIVLRANSKREQEEWFRELVHVTFVELDRENVQNINDDTPKLEISVKNEPEMKTEIESQTHVTSSLTEYKTKKIESRIRVLPKEFNRGSGVEEKNAIESRIRLFSKDSIEKGLQVKKDLESRIRISSKEDASETETKDDIESRIRVLSKKCTENETETNKHNIRVVQTNCKVENELEIIFKRRRKEPIDSQSDKEDDYTLKKNILIDGTNCASALNVSGNILKSIKKLQRKSHDYEDIDDILDKRYPTRQKDIENDIKKTINFYKVKLKSVRNYKVTNTLDSVTENEYNNSENNKLRINENYDNVNINSEFSENEITCAKPMEVKLLNENMNLCKTLPDNQNIEHIYDSGSLINLNEVCSKTNNLEEMCQNLNTPVPALPKKQRIHLLNRNLSGSMMNEFHANEKVVQQIDSLLAELETFSYEEKKKTDEDDEPDYDDPIPYNSLVISKHYEEGKLNSSYLDEPYNLDTKWIEQKMCDLADPGVRYPNLNFGNSADSLNNNVMQKNLYIK